MTNHKRILFAPLDWGLGHITRCIPLIKECVRLGHEVIIAGNEVCHQLLKEDFPGLVYLDLPGYNIRYASKRWQLPFSMLKQLPKIWASIRFEHNWLKQMVKEYQIDLVISDNRYGLYHSTIECIFITHQLQIQVPASHWIQSLVRRINEYYIKQFKACWVPDYQHEAMAGCLSNNVNEHLNNIEYLGNLSRFGSMSHQEQKYDILVLLSGPEPQRSILEALLVSYLENKEKKVLIVRGKPLDSVPMQTIKNIGLVNHLPWEELEKAILQSAVIICRSGYSTIMDLIKLKKHAILIPTPGQTEQEYLAQYLMDKNLFLFISQEKLPKADLMNAYQDVKFSNFPVYNTQLYQSVLSAYLN